MHIYPVTPSMDMLVYSNDWEAMLVDIGYPTVKLEDNSNALKPHNAGTYKNDSDNLWTSCVSHQHPNQTALP